ncbi:MAG: class I SAM-dependent methyltransferase [Myxococcales bacterium]|nr:class I SAM-dependent methyltransferase [Myxococcales bacterium]
MSAKGSRYRTIAPLYEGMALLYSGGQMRACGAFQAAGLSAGERVLHAGGGAGEDACRAADQGCAVTLVDSSPEMLARARAALTRSGHPEVELLCEDIFAHDRPGAYDVVCANFFFGVFSKSDLPRLVAHLGRQLRAGGRLLVADFALAGGPLLRLVQQVYHAIPVAFYAVAAGNPVRPLYDYGPYLERARFRITERRLHRVFHGPELFQTLTATRP